jgi:oligoribonuclease
VQIGLGTTGLYPFTDRVLEVATFVTNFHLDILVDGPIITIHQPKELAAAMDPWNTKPHLSW